MNPPIRDGSGDSIGSIRLGDGSEISEVRTGAGDVLFSASAIPDSGIYLDDVADNKLNNRDTYSTTGFDGTEPASSTFSNPSRPEWSVDSGGPSASGEEIVLPAGDSTNQIISTPLSNDKLRWDFEFECQSTPSFGRLGIQLLWESNNDVYQVDIQGNGTYRIQKREGGTGSVIIDGTWDGDAQRHTGAVEHDGNGNWELFYDGASQGTASDSYLPNFTDVRLANGGAAEIGLDSEVRVDNFRVF